MKVSNLRKVTGNLLETGKIVLRMPHSHLDQPEGVKFFFSIFQFRTYFLFHYSIYFSFPVVASFTFSRPAMASADKDLFNTDKLSIMKYFKEKKISNADIIMFLGNYHLIASFLKHLPETHLFLTFNYFLNLFLF